MNWERPMCPCNTPEGSRCRFILEERDGGWWCPSHGQVKP